MKTAPDLHKRETAPASGTMPAQDTDVREFHTRLLRTSMALEECRAYWEHVRPDIPYDQCAVVAFEERWFGNKSMARVRELLATCRHRFDTYPMALTVLRHWRPSDPVTRLNICHWHLQLSDPLYRAFTGRFLEQRRLHPQPKVDRDVTVRWMQQMLDGRWGSATLMRIATSLLTSAAAAGLCFQGNGARSLKYPKVTDEALAYLFYVLRHLSFEETLLENPYVASVGLTEGLLEQRLRRLPGMAFQRMGELWEFGWHYPDLKAWARHELALSWEDGA